MLIAAVNLLNSCHSAIMQVKQIESLIVGQAENTHWKKYIIGCISNSNILSMKIQVSDMISQAVTICDNAKSLDYLPQFKYHRLEEPFVRDDYEKLMHAECKVYTVSWQSIRLLCTCSTYIHGCQPMWVSIMQLLWGRTTRDQMPMVTC